VAITHRQNAVIASPTRSRNVVAEHIGNRVPNGFKSCASVQQGYFALLLVTDRMCHQRQSDVANFADPPICHADSAGMVQAH